MLATLGQIRMLEGSFTDAEHLAEEAIKTAEACGPGADAWLGHALCTLGVVDGWLGRPESAVTRLERALAIAVRLDRLDDAFRARANLATILDLEGRREEAVRIAHAGIAAAEAAGLEAVHGNRLRSGAVDTLFQLGRWREARDLAVHALAWAPAGIAFVHAAVGFITVETELSAGRRGHPDAGAPSRGAGAPGRHAVRRSDLPGGGVPRALAGRPGGRPPRRGRGLGSGPCHRGLGAGRADRGHACSPSPPT